ncbi:GFA family protein [Acidithiobacillus ferrivorans]|uniref:GFA family protein n=1 Tax=Acidithiobacillus ferrivorans TaxID=160808 RepID=UPI0009E0A3C4
MLGGCLCGAILYEAIGHTVFSVNCHCRDCQRTSGGAYTPALFVPETSITISGEVTYYASTAYSGRKVSRGFCPKCGSQLCAKLEILPDIIGIRAGTLDDSSLFNPGVDIFTSSAARWDLMNPDIPKFQREPG